MKNRLTTGTTAPDFTFDTPWKQSLSFYDFLKDEKALLVFLRYMGCPLCRLKLSEMIQDWHEFEKADVHLFIVLQSLPEIIRESTEEKDMPMTLICDPEMKIFDLYKVYPGSLFRYLTLEVIQKALRAKKQGFKHGKSEGKELQLPAVFLIGTDKKVQYAYYGKNIGDIPDNQTILNTINKNPESLNP